MDFGLTERQQRTFDCGRLFAAKFDRSYWNDHVERGAFPFELWRELGTSGHLGTLVPEANGGAGLGATEMALLAEGLAAAGFPLPSLITGPALALPVLAASGTERQKNELLPALVAGLSVMPFAITEAGVGSNLFALRTRAEPRGDHFLLTGVKNYTSGADVAEMIMVVARTPAPAGAERQRDGFTVFVVPTGAPGVTREFADTQVPMPERSATSPSTTSSSALSTSSESRAPAFLRCTPDLSANER